MKTQLTALLAILALSGLGGCETPPYHGDVRVQHRDLDVRVVFSDRDRVIIRDYYRSDYRRLPPGLAKKGKVPPGHAFKMQRQQSLPPDIRWAHLPATIETRLSRLPDGYVRIIVGADIAIMHTRTRVIVDLLEGINDES